MPLNMMPKTFRPDPIAVRQLCRTDSVTVRTSRKAALIITKIDPAGVSHSQVRQDRLQILFGTSGLRQPVWLEIIVIPAETFPEADAFKDHRSDRLNTGAQGGHATGPIRLHER